MRFQRYTDVDVFVNNVLGILLEDEVRNNLLISILVDSNRDKANEWLMSTVTDDHGVIILIAMCTRPFYLLLSQPGESRCDITVVEFLASELKRIGFVPSGVLAVKELAGSFVNVYCGSRGSRLHMTMTLMRLDEPADHDEAPGFCRMLTEEDLSFAPSWEQAFCVDCRIPVNSLPEIEARLRARIGMNIHYIWDDGLPVAQAVFGRSTPNGAAVSWVYTPPEYRGRGYATSVVAELSKNILGSGKQFCCLFADAANPASCAVYHKLGYYDVCLFDEIKFDIS